MKEAEGNFIMLPPKASIYAYEGKDICIRGSASNLPYQHMIKGDFEKGEDYFYLDLKAGGQVVAYHRGLAIPAYGVEKWFCGRVGTVHGMTKRGDQKYSECYLQVVEIRD